MYTKRTHARFVYYFTVVIATCPSVYANACMHVLHVSKMFRPVLPLTPAGSVCTYGRASRTHCACVHVSTTCPDGEAETFTDSPVLEFAWLWNFFTPVKQDTGCCFIVFVEFYLFIWPWSEIVFRIAEKYFEFTITFLPFVACWTRALALFLLLVAFRTITLGLLQGHFHSSCLLFFCSLTALPALLTSSPDLYIK